MGENGESSDIRPVIRPKSIQKLESQLDAVSKIVNSPILPPNVNTRDMISTSRQQLKVEYPERYTLFLKILRATKGLRTNVDQQKISDDELLTHGLNIEMLNSLADYSEKHKYMKDSDEARDRKQHTVSEDILAGLEKGERKGNVKLPTGVGKTAVFIRLVEALGPSAKIVIAVPKENLIDKTVDDFSKFASDVKIAKYYGGEKNIDDDGNFHANVILTTYDSLVAHTELFKPDSVDVLILDEAHKALGPERKKTIDTFQNAIKIGFTATPKYSEERQVANILPYTYHEMSTVEAIREDLLCKKVKVEGIASGVDLSSLSSSTDSDGVTDFTNAALSSKINTPERNKIAIDYYTGEHEGKLGVAFCAGVDHAKDFAEQLRKKGVTAEAIWGNMSKSAKDEIYKKYKGGEIKILCNADLLIEGFDVPAASVCLNLRPTMSLVNAEQRAGRVLRKDPANPDKTAYIFEIIDKNRKNKQVLYEQILDGSAEVQSDQTNGGSEVTKEDKPIRYVDGKKLITDPLEMRMEIEREEKDPYKDRTWFSYDDLQKICGINSQEIRLLSSFMKENPVFFQEKNNGDIICHKEAVNELIFRLIRYRMNLYLLKSKLNINEMQYPINTLLETNPQIPIDFIKTTDSEILRVKSDSECSKIVRNTILYKTLSDPKKLSVLRRAMDLVA